MKTLVSALVATAALAALLAPRAAAAQTSDETQIRDLEAGVAAAISAKDVDAILKAYSPDIFVFDVVPPRQYVGAAAWRADWQGVFAGMKGPMKVEIQDLTVTTDGSIGYSHSIQHFVNDAPDGSKVVMNIRTSDVYRKIDGKWLIVEEHLSVPVDLMTGKPDLASKP